LLESQDLRGFIEILFAALVASGPESLVDGRARRDGVGLGERDSVPEK